MNFAKVSGCLKYSTVVISFASPLRYPAYAEMMRYKPFQGLIGFFAKISAV